MDEFLGYLTWILVEVVLIQTGRAAVFVCSLGCWRSENLSANESRIHSAAGALSFVRDNQRVVTINGLLFAGIASYVLATLGLFWYLV